MSVRGVGVHVSSSLSPSPSSSSPSPVPINDTQQAAEEKALRTQHILAQWQHRVKRSSSSSSAASSSVSSSSAPSSSSSSLSSPPSVPIRFKTLFRNTILDVFRSKGWTETHSETEWDIFWTNKEWVRTILEKVHLDAHQRVNHFRNFYELTRKDLLIKNLKRTKRDLMKKGMIAEAEQNYSFFPDTFSLPAEYSLFVEQFKNNNSNSAVYIMKPIGSSQGKGIFLFERLSQISEWKKDYRYKIESSVGERRGGAGAAEAQQAEKYIVQRYIDNPLLIGGKKFDLRIYVLCMSYAPLVAYMYREGFARFSSTRYSNERATIHDNYVHLTNVAIQKTGENYDEQTGGKWDVRSLKLYLTAKFGADRVDKLFAAIVNICIYSLLSVQKVMISDKNSFELYGYDILIDDQLKPVS